MEKKYYELCADYKYTPITLDPTSRTIVFGDLHGDYNLTKELLVSSGVGRFDSDDKVTWTGGDTIVVQLGDQVDRCRLLTRDQDNCNGPNDTVDDEASDIKIMELFTELHNQAVLSGGAVVSLLGNHELMNVLGFMQYVSYKNIQMFEDYKDPENPDKKYGSAMEARKHAFAEGNEYAKFLACTRVPAVIIGSNLFVHGGIVNRTIQDFKINDREYIENLADLLRLWMHRKKKRSEVKDELDNKYSFFWSRMLGEIPPNIAFEDPQCTNAIADTIDTLCVDNIVVGHMPQTRKGINSTCSKRVWRIDTGSSKAFDIYARGEKKHGRRAQWLEIIHGNKKDVFRKCDKSECTEIDVEKTKFYDKSSRRCKRV